MSILSEEKLLESGKLFKKNFQSRSLDTCAASSTQCPNFQGLFTSKVTWYYKWNLKPKRWIWENCNANGKMTKNKCVSYWTRDISSWSLEEKLHWYNITHGVNSSLLIQSWQELFIRKKLSVIILDTLWSCHGESGRWKFERTVTLMGRWPKTNVYHIEQGIYWVDHLKRNCIGTT